MRSPRNWDCVLPTIHMVMHQHISDVAPMFRKTISPSLINAWRDFQAIVVFNQHSIIFTNKARLQLKPFSPEFASIAWKALCVMPCRISEGHWSIDIFDPPHFVDDLHTTAPDRRARPCLALCFQLRKWVCPPPRKRRPRQAPSPSCSAPSAAPPLQQRSMQTREHIMCRRDN